MNTLTIQIGNSDDKLTQKRWAQFIRDVAEAVERSAFEIHFRGCSEPDKDWQNACWVIAVSDEGAEELRCNLKDIREEYCQDSVAWTMGATMFV